MFTNITWTNYIVVIILLLVIYYVFVGIRFYYQDLKNLIDKRKLKTAPIITKPSPKYLKDTEVDQPRFTPSESFVQINEDDPFKDIEHLVSRLNEAIREASANNTARQEFSQRLCFILKEYPELKASPFQSAVSELITSECAKYGSIMLSEDEIMKLWEEV